MNHTFKRLKRTHMHLAVICAATTMTGLVVAPAMGSDSSFAAKSKATQTPALKITAGIRVWGGVRARNGALVQIFFTPSVVNVGTYTVVARNYDDTFGHVLSINGVTSRWMGPGRGTAVMKVTFKRPGLYTATVHIDGAERGGSAFLKVVE
jgi:hypothetical protein